MKTAKEHYTDLKWHQKIAFNLLWGLCWVISYLPRFIRYGLLRPFITLLLRLSGYRKKVILRNLRNAFPEKSEKEIKRIMVRYYVTLSEVAVNIVSLISASQKRKQEALQCDKTDEHVAKTKNTDWIMMPAHYGCWEYYPLWSWKDKSQEFVGVYHPMRNSIFELLFLRIRSFGENNTLVPMADAVRYYVKNRSEEHKMVIGLISDQSPILRADTEWIEFFNQPTAFIDGGARIGLRFGIPIYFTYAERIKADSYKIRHIEIYDGKEQVESIEIVRRYAKHLEAMVRECPELWMWSHNRWKHTPEKQARKFGNKK